MPGHPEKTSGEKKCSPGVTGPGVLRVLRVLLDLIKALNMGAASPEAMDDSPRVQPG